MRYVLVLPLVLWLLAGCMAQPGGKDTTIPAQRIHALGHKTSTRNARLFVRRASHDSQCDVTLLVDRTRVARLRQGESGTFWVTPGTHKVYVHDFSGRCSNGSGVHRVQASTDHVVNLVLMARPDFFSLQQYTDDP